MMSPAEMLRMTGKGWIDELYPNPKKNSDCHRKFARPNAKGGKLSNREETVDTKRYQIL
jgi:hypothetical protein